MKRFAAHTKGGRVATHKNSFVKRKTTKATKQQQRFRVLAIPRGYRVVVLSASGNVDAEIESFVGDTASDQATALADRLNIALHPQKTTQCAGDSKCSYPVLRGGDFCHFHDRQQ